MGLLLPKVQGLGPCPLDFPLKPTMVKELKTFKILSDCHIKTSQSLNLLGGLFWKSLAPFFRRTFSAGFKINPLKNCFPVVRQKPTQILLQKGERSKKEQPLIFCLFDESPFSNICTLCMWQWNVLNLIDCANNCKISEAVKILFQ